MAEKSRNKTKHVKIYNIYKIKNHVVRYDIQQRNLEKEAQQQSEKK